MLGVGVRVGEGGSAALPPNVPPAIERDGASATGRTKVRPANNASRGTAAWCGGGLSDAEPLLHQGYDPAT